MNDARRDRFDAEQVELLEGIACHLGGAIEATQTMSSVSPVGIFRVDSEGYGTYVNERCAEIIGMSPAQAVGAPWGNCVHPDDRRRIIPEWIPALQAGRQFKSEYRICAPDGTVTWVLGQALADKGADGRIRGYVGTIVDITERKRAEDALQQSEQRYRTIFSAAPVSLWEEDFSLVKNLIDDAGEWRGTTCAGTSVRIRTSYARASRPCASSTSTTRLSNCSARAPGMSC